MLYPFLGMPDKGEDWICEELRDHRALLLVPPAGQSGSESCVDVGDGGSRSEPDGRRAGCVSCARPDLAPRRASFAFGLQASRPYPGVTCLPGLYPSESAVGVGVGIGPRNRTSESALGVGIGIGRRKSTLGLGPPASVHRTRLRVASPRTKALGQRAWHSPRHRTRCVLPCPLLGSPPTRFRGRCTVFLGLARVSASSWSRAQPSPRRRTCTSGIPPRAIDLCRSRGRVSG
jgi:hypothetical protein